MGELIVRRNPLMVVLALSLSVIACKAKQNTEQESTIASTDKKYPINRTITFPPFPAKPKEVKNVAKGIYKGEPFSVEYSTDLDWVIFDGYLPEYLGGGSDIDKRIQDVELHQFGVASWRTKKNILVENWRATINPHIGGLAASMEAQFKGTAQYGRSVGANQIRDAMFIYFAAKKLGSATKPSSANLSNKKNVDLRAERYRLVIQKLKERIYRSN